MFKDFLRTRLEVADFVIWAERSVTKPSHLYLSHLVS